MSDPKMITVDLVGIEDYREYDFVDANGIERVYRIDYPMKLEFKKGASTHRITDTNGVVHVVPAPGHFGCVMRFVGKVIF